MKMKYDESDNTLIRASRAITDKMTDLIGKGNQHLRTCGSLRSHSDRFGLEIGFVCYIHIPLMKWGVEVCLL